MNVFLSISFNIYFGCSKDETGLLIIHNICFGRVLNICFGAY